MLDDQNSLLTAISNEECATVCGGYGVIFNSDGSVTLTGTGSGTFQTDSGQNQSVTINSAFSIAPNFFGGANFSIAQTSVANNGDTTYSLSSFLGLQ